MRRPANFVAETRAECLAEAGLVRTFSCTDTTVIEPSGKNGNPSAGLPIASDDQEALTIAAGFVTDAGYDPAVVGILVSAARLEASR